MKWRNHKIATFASVWFLSGDILGAFVASLGAIFPDSIEGRFDIRDPGQYQLWRAKHRKFSHWFVMYLLLFSFSAVFLAFQTSIWTPFKILSNVSAFEDPLLPTVTCLLVYFIAGCMFHILQDMLTGKVPLLSIRKRRGVRIFTTGSTPETIFTLLFAASLAVLNLKIYRGHGLLGL